MHAIYRMIVRVDNSRKKLRELHKHRTSCINLRNPQLPKHLLPSTHIYSDRALALLARKLGQTLTCVAHVYQHVMQARLQEHFAYHKAQAGVNSSIRSLVMGTAAAQRVLVKRPCARVPIGGCIQNVFPSAAHQQHRTVVKQHLPAQHIPSSTCQQQSAQLMHASTSQSLEVITSFVLH